jgi:aspartate aminotransferase
VFFDSAYQGFASGDAEADAQALRNVVEEGLPVLLAQSFAKNFGLYGERCGTLSVVCKDAEQKEILMSQLKCIIRPMYSSPPKHGSSVVRTVLSDDDLTEQYYKQCSQMADRIQSMRTRLVETIKQAGSAHDWSHVTEQIGMFAFTGEFLPSFYRYLFSSVYSIIQLFFLLSTYRYVGGNVRPAH